MIDNPIPDAVGLDLLLVGQSQFGAILAASQGLRYEVPMEAVPGHDSIANEGEIQVGEFGKKFRVGWLRGDFGDFPILPEEAIQVFLGQFCCFATGLLGDKLNLEAGSRESVEIFEPRDALDETNIDASEGVEPWLQGGGLELL